MQHESRSRAEGERAKRKQLTSKAAVAVHSTQRPCMHTQSQTHRERHWETVDIHIQRQRKTMKRGLTPFTDDDDDRQAPTRERVYG